MIGDNNKWIIYKDINKLIDNDRVIAVQVMKMFE